MAGLHRPMCMLKHASTRTLTGRPGDETGWLCLRAAPRRLPASLAKSADPLPGLSSASGCRGRRMGWPRPAAAHDGPAPQQRTAASSAIASQHSTYSSVYATSGADGFVVGSHLPSLSHGFLPIRHRASATRVSGGTVLMRRKPFHHLLRPVKSVLPPAAARLGPFAGA